MKKGKVQNAGKTGQRVWHQVSIYEYIESQEPLFPDAESSADDRSVCSVGHLLAPLLPQDVEAAQIETPSQVRSIVAPGGKRMIY
jgi:hypothetical protein